jgi:hypothetical protein
MTVFELLTTDVKINVPFVQKLEQIVKKTLPEDLKKSLSFSSGFYDTDKRMYRLLNTVELLDTKKYLGVDIVLNGKLPVFDIGDNDFICYDFNTNKYLVFNIIDQSSFFDEQTLHAVIVKLEK